MIAVRTSSTRARFSRRALLRRLGASAAMLPLLHAERARAATPSGFPKRLITVAWANGVAQPSFYPPGEDPTESPILQPLAPFKSKVLLPCGMDLKIMLDGGRTYDGHFSYPTLFTGTYKNLGGQSSTATGASVDQAVSDAIARQVNLPVPLLNVVISGRSTSYRPDGQRNTGETDPARLFTTLFAGRTTPPEQINVLGARRKSVIDYLAAELSSFTGKLGTEDRAKVGAHLDSIRKLELELTATANPAACTSTNPGAASDYQSKMKVFSDLIAMAVRCDLTRSVSLVWADNGGSGPSTLPFLGFSGAADGLGEVHAIAHQGSAGYASKVKIDTWYMTQLAYLAKLLDDSPEAGGTILDHSVIAVGNDMSEGSFHSVSAIPFILIGSCGGYFRTGRTVKVGSWAGKTGQYWRSGNTGVPNNRLLASLCNAMDVPVTGFGAPAYGGVLSELT
jgi:hypothetical protein